ncbi:hypothetical protein Tco_1264997 [Tanacetum coccineum]
MIVDIEECRHGTSDAMHNLPSAPGGSLPPAPITKQTKVGHISGVRVQKREKIHNDPTALSWNPIQGDYLNLPDLWFMTLVFCSLIPAKVVIHKPRAILIFQTQVDQGSQIKMIQVKEMMQDNDLKNSNGDIEDSLKKNEDLTIGIYGGKLEDVGLDELEEGSKEVVSKIGEFGGDIGSELLGDREGDVIFSGGKGGKGGGL